MTREERDLIVAARRWARANGWELHHWRGAINATYDSDATLTINVTDGMVCLWRKRDDGTWPLRSVDHAVESVRQGVDLLCALGVLPAWMSSQWQAGLTAGVQLAGPVRAQVMADAQTVLAEVTAA